MHSAVVSSALLAAVPRGPGRPGWAESGHLTRDAHHAARRAARDTMTAGQRRRLPAGDPASGPRALGIGAIHELAGPDMSGTDDLLAHARAGRRPSRGPTVLAYWGELGTGRCRHRALELGALGAAGDLFADGSIGSHTACFARPTPTRRARTATAT